jgi:hypothetical protein
MNGREHEWWQQRPNLRYTSRIFLEELTKITKYLIQDSGLQADI